MSDPEPHLARVRPPRRIEAGARRAQGVGDRLSCLLLSRLATEWIAVDLGSGAFVRVVGPLGIEPPPPGGPGLVVEIRVGLDAEPIDPARPESVTPARPPLAVGTVASRAMRRLLRRLCAPERRGATLLGTRGPSIAYVDLDGSEPSLTLLEVPAKSLELIPISSREVVVGFEWGGTHHVIPIVEEAWQAFAAPLRARPGASARVALGHRSGFVLVGLGPVTQGHARKVVLALG